MEAQKDLFSEEDVNTYQKEYRHTPIPHTDQAWHPLWINFLSLCVLLSLFIGLPWKEFWDFSGIQNYGIGLFKITNYSISGFCDANWEGDITDRKSHTCILVYLCDTFSGSVLPEERYTGKIKHTSWASCNCINIGRVRRNQIIFYWVRGAS